MKTVLPFVCAIAMFAAYQSSAQPGRPAPKPRLRVVVGDSATYHTTYHVDATQVIMGSEVPIIVDATGIATLRVVAVDRDEVTWEYSVPSLAISLRTGPTAEEEIDTVAHGPLTIITDRKGQVLSQSSSEIGASPLNLFLDQAMQGDWSALLFSPVIAQGALRGETWSERVSDSAAGESGYALSRSLVRVYTYDGLVDTLGRSMMRVRSRSDSLEIAGRVPMGQAAMAIAGSGQQVTVAYYDAVSGMLRGAWSDGETSLMVSMGGAVPMAVPVTMQTRYRVSPR